MSKRSMIRLDVLAPAASRAVLRARWFPVALQALALAAVIGLAWIGFSVAADRPASELLTLRKTNLTTLVVWGLWWPGLIALTLLFGRVWCTVCPMELVHRLGDAAGRRLPLPRARMGAFLRAGWMTLLAYFVLQVLVAGAALHRNPHYTAWLLAALFGLAFASGLFFRGGRAFCTGFCPASALLSVYGRFTPVQLEKRDAAACEECRDRACIAARNRARFDRRSCPSHLRPYERAPSDGCVLCLQCAKVCPQENIGLGLVSRAAGVRRQSVLRPFEVLFVIIASGFVAHEVIGEVKWLDEVFHAVPSALQRVAPSLPFGWFEAFWFLALFPAALWLAVAGVAWLAGHRGGFGALLTAAATGAAPVVALAHLAKAAAKISAWGAYAPLAVPDPRGLDTAERLLAGDLAAPAPLLGLSPIGWLTVIATALVAWRSLRGLRRSSHAELPAAAAGLAVTAAFFGAVLIVWTRA